MPRKKVPVTKRKSHVLQGSGSVLDEYINDLDLIENKIFSKKLQNGHIVAYFQTMKKSRKVSSENFYQIIQNSKLLRDNFAINNSDFTKLFISVLGKYEYIVKKDKKNLKLCSKYLKQFFFSVSSKKVYETISSENISDLPRTNSVVDKRIINSKNQDSKLNPYLSLLKEQSTENENDLDIYERYFDLASQDIDVVSKNQKLGALMEDAMSKLHDIELHNHKLRSALAEILDELNLKNNKLDEFELKLKNDSERGNIVVNLSKQINEKDDLILKLKFENKQFSNIVKKKDEYIKVLEDKTARKFEKNNKSLVVALSDSRKINAGVVHPGRGRRKKEETETVSSLSKDKNSSKDKTTSNSLEKKVTKLVNDCNNPKISELLLESFPDISISDFEVILKVLSDSNALLGQRIVHKWNVNGKDITYYGTIKENLKNQKKFYITYGKIANKEEADTDFELVDYISLISDIILKDLSFLDPCSLF